MAGTPGRLLILRRRPTRTDGHDGHGRWHAERGNYLLSARATDATGRTQPLAQRWSRGGFANNTIQRIPVSVISSEMSAPAP